MPRRATHQGSATVHENRCFHAPTCNYSLEASFNISRPVLQTFCLDFAAWFDEEYYVAYIGGMCGVGLDTHTEIVESERLFRALGLPGVLTCMDAVHMAYDKAPYPSRHLLYLSLPP